MTVEMIAFQPDLIPEAASLLAYRQQRDRVQLPELPARFEELARARAALEVLSSRPHAHGFAALRSGRLVAYLLGELVLEAIWGRSAWVRHAGYGLAPGESPELIRDLYAALGQRWLEYGCFAHFALASAVDQSMLDAWFRLSFGIEQVHALLDLDGLELTTQDDPVGAEIRKAAPEDRQAVAGISDVIWSHQVGTPVWGIILPEELAEIREGWSELVDDPMVNLWLAFYQGEAVGVQGSWPLPEADDNLLVPQGCLRLSVAGTRAGYRDRGIGQALTRRTLSEAQEAGYHFVETDWRSTNLTSSRFWPRQGFRPVAYRLVRRIDTRIAWARREI